MNYPDIADRLAESMELAGIASIPKLARKSGIDQNYLYRLAKGEIGNPQKYLEVLTRTLGVSPVWFSTGRGDPHDHESVVHREDAWQQTTMLTKVMVVPAEGDLYDVIARVPDLFNSPFHAYRQPSAYRFFYMPEMVESFPGCTLLTVEKELRPGPGLFLAWKTVHGHKRLFTFTCTYSGLEVSSTQQPDWEVVGRVRNMDYWKIELPD